MRRSPKFALRWFSTMAILVAATTGCPPPRPPEPEPGGKPRASAGHTPQTSEGLLAAADAAAASCAANGWTEPCCTSVATSRIAVSNASEQEGKGILWTELYNAAVTYQHCNDEVEARKLFARVVEQEPRNLRARIAVALCDFRQGGSRDVDAAIAAIERAIADGDAEAEAFAQVAALRLQRARAGAGAEGRADLARAREDLTRSLSLDDRFTPAVNLLARSYLDEGRMRVAEAGKGDGSASAAGAAFNMGLLVASQGLRHDPSFAPLHHTRGLIARALGRLPEAAGAFRQARELDPKSFDAHVDYASANLELRGFAEAEKAYRAALALRPRDYDAHLGLGLALRGQLTDKDRYAVLLADTARELEAAQAIDPSRPETYFNLAILTQNFKARDAAAGSETALLEAKSLFAEFIAKAGTAADHAAAVATAKQHMREIDSLVEFQRQSRTGPSPKP